MVNLTRSAFTGQQRYTTITWSGDVNATWDVFRRQIPAGLSFSMSGLPYWTTDIGGFFVQSAKVGALGHGQWFREGGFDGGLEDEGYKELYVRWFQYGAFRPIFRAHGTDVPREIWRFGKPGDWAYDALLKADQLRYRLMPYLYSNAWSVTSQGYTLMRGLVMDFASDPQALDVGDQYMFGPAFVVNPITKPTDRFPSVYLPEGADGISSGPERDTREGRRFRPSPLSTRCRSSSGRGRSFPGTVHPVRNGVRRSHRDPGLSRSRRPLHAV